MTAPTRFHGARWPTPVEMLLLRAAVMPAPQAAQAWERWARGGRLDAVTGDAFTILSNVYRTLAAAPGPVSDLGRLKGIYRRTWYVNQALVGNAGVVLRALGHAGIPVVALKGLPLLTQWRRDLGIRGMDVDVLVPPAKIEDVVRVLQGLGFRSHTRLREPLAGTFRLLHRVSFERGPGATVDLHTHALQECCYDGADDGLWRRAQPFAAHGFEALRPSAGDLLLLVCVHGVRGAPSKVLHWIPDALALISGQEPIDWETLIAEARRRRVSLALGQALVFLRQELAAPVPAFVPSALLATRHGLAERLDYAIEGRAPAVFWMAARDVMRYLRLTRKWAPIQRATGFPSYLEALWGMEDIWHLPQEAWRRIGDRPADNRAGGGTGTSRAG